MLAMLAALLLGTVARADDLSEFEKGRNSYNAGRYEEAAEKFGEMLNPKYEHALRDTMLIERARIYRVACLIAISQVNEADSEIETILRTNPNAYPDPVVFPTLVLDRFTDVRARLREELDAKAREKARKEQLEREKERELQRKERERVARLEELAREESHVVHNSRWLALVPFGVGQFQNEQPALGWTLLLTETALATASVVTASIAQSVQAQGTEPNVDIEALNDQVHTLKTINNLSFAGFVVVAVGGVAHAQLSFVPERVETRTRGLPKALRATPTVSVTPGGGTIGLVGSF
jgi:tetratricopeptide (TPR) repeat protein